MPSETHSVTDLIEAHRRGEPRAFEEFVALLYGDLHRIAHFQRRRLRPGETLNTTALVHEAFAKIAQQTSPQWEGRSHFLGVVGRAMRHILVDTARRRLSAKRGGGHRPETLEDSLHADTRHAKNVLAIDQALDQLRALDERMCRVVECQFFAGLSREETAEALGISPRTVHRDWLRAKAWLHKLLSPTKPGERTTDDG